MTLRPETEWVETVEAGWNELAGTDPGQILAAVKRNFPDGLSHPSLFGDGRSAERIAEIIETYIEVIN